MTTSYEVNVYVLRLASRHDYVEHADDGKSTFNLQASFAQRFPTREAAQLAAKGIPAALIVESIKGETQDGKGERATISVAGGSPDESLAVPTQVAGRKATVSATPYHRVCVVGPTGRRTPVSGWFLERGQASAALHQEQRFPDRRRVVVRYTKLGGKPERSRAPLQKAAVRRRPEASPQDE